MNNDGPNNGVVGRDSYARVMHQVSSFRSNGSSNVRQIGSFPGSSKWVVALKFYNFSSRFNHYSMGG